MNRQILVTATILGVLAVVLGAFGAHALKAKLTVDELDNWKTAVSYQFYHTLVLLFLAQATGLKYQQAACYFFLAGIILFSGSIYLLSTRSMTGITRTSLLGPLTPLGGLSFIIGWILLLISAVKVR